ncbi:MAG: calcium-binding protein [Nostocaceae cyanobacterium]|nr:calcium-binding protein [Nostocaceae cyanobacterium]
MEELNLELLAEELSLSSEDLSVFDNIIIGTPFDDKLKTTELNDIVIALAGDDTIYGSKGKDTIVGGEGQDTVDYRGLGQAITLEAAGVVKKGIAGTDRLFEIETIIGAVGQANTINAFTATDTTTSVNVNLLANSLIVNGVPGIGSLKFNVVNFVNVAGTSQDDKIIGDNGNNLLDGKGGNDSIFGLGGNDTVRGGAGDDVISGGYLPSPFVSAASDGNDILRGGSGNDRLIAGIGKDFLDGGTGVDTADYSSLSQAITLLSVGVVNKGTLGTDEILNIEKIIGATNKANAIDGSTGTSKTTSFDVDLSIDSLTVNGIPGLGSANFTVEKFVNVTGTSQNDSIVGDNNNNQLGGGQGNDKISGLGGKDTITGVNPLSFKPGINEVDFLYGGADSDKFVVGDQKNAYYLGGGGIFGLNDFAFLGDFQTGQDKIQLNKSQRYLFGRNYIAVSKYFYSAESVESQLKLAESQDSVIPEVEAVANDIINNNGSLGTTTKVSETSLDSSLIFPNFDVVAIVNNGYTLSDITFV